ncbi:MAG TPA: hypothetical protein VF690_21525, partial [Hymenobacter sp.]
MALSEETVPGKKAKISATANLAATFLLVIAGIERTESTAALVSMITGAARPFFLGFRREPVAHSTAAQLA